MGPRAKHNAGIVFMLFGAVLTVLGLVTVLEFSLDPVNVKPTVMGAA